MRVMIDRTDRQYVTLRGQRHPLTFNLTKEIELVDSVGCPGIQLADVVSGVAIYLLRNRNQPDVHEWMRIYEGKIHPHSMFPDFDVVDLQQKRGMAERGCFS